jgi:hypothetical protein
VNTEDDALKEDLIKEALWLDLSDCSAASGGPFVTALAPFVVASLITMMDLKNQSLVRNNRRKFIILFYSDVGIWRRALKCKPSHFFYTSPQKTIT